MMDINEENSRNISTPQISVSEVPYNKKLLIAFSALVTVIQQNKVKRSKEEILILTRKILDAITKLATKELSNGGHCPNDSDTLNKQLIEFIREFDPSLDEIISYFEMKGYKQEKILEVFNSIKPKASRDSGELNQLPTPPPVRTTPAIFEKVTTMRGPQISVTSEKSATSLRQQLIEYVEKCDPTEEEILTHCQDMGYPAEMVYCELQTLINNGTFYQPQYGRYSLLQGLFNDPAAE